MRFYLLIICSVKHKKIGFNKNYVDWTSSNLIIEMFQQISVKCNTKPVSSTNKNFNTRKRNPHLLSYLKIVQNSAEKIKPQERSSHVPIIVVHAHKIAVDINKGPSNPSLTRLIKWRGCQLWCQVHKAKYIIFMRQLKKENQLCYLSDCTCSVTKIIAIQFAWPPGTFSTCSHN